MFENFLADIYKYDILTTTARSEMESKIPDIRLSLFSLMYVVLDLCIVAASVLFSEFW